VTEVLAILHDNGANPNFSQLRPHFKSPQLNTEMPDEDRTEGQGRLSDFEKGQIVALWQEFGHVAKILPRLTHPRSESTVRNFIRRYQARNSTRNLPAPGRPLKMNLRTRNRVFTDSKENRTQSVRQLRDNLAPEVSTRTVKRYCNGSFVFRLGDELEYEEEVLCSGIRICNGDFYYVLFVSVMREYESSSD
jgi:hypothetical protein